MATHERRRYAALQGLLIVNPEAGNLIRGTGGASQDEVAGPGKDKRDGGIRMKKRLLNELVESIREAGRIHRGDAAPSRRFVFDPEDVGKTRAELNQSHGESR